MSYALATLVRQGRGRVDNFETLAEEMIQVYGGITALQLAPGGTISQVVPLKGNESVIGFSPLRDPVQGAETQRVVETPHIAVHTRSRYARVNPVRRIPETPRCRVQALGRRQRLLMPVESLQGLDQYHPTPERTLDIAADNIARACRGLVCVRSTTSPTPSPPST